jgi:hypothetical protein
MGGIEMAIKLTQVKCVRTSSGTGSAVPILSTVAGGIVGGTVGTVAGVALATASGGTLVAIGVAAGVGGASGGAALGAEFFKIVNGIFDGSDDDLYIKVNGEKIWPTSGKCKDVGSQDTITVNYDLPLVDPCRIELFDYDTISSDDSLGYLNVPANHSPGPFMYLVENEDEGSAYQIWLDISPNFPMGTNTEIKKGYRYYTANYAFSLQFQEDGNLTVTRISDNTNIWYLQKVVSNLADYANNIYVQFSSDGILFTKSRDRVTWQTDTQGHPGAELMLDENTGILSITENGKTLWSSV